VATVHAHGQRPTVSRQDTAAQSHVIIAGGRKISFTRFTTTAHSTNRLFVYFTHDQDQYASVLSTAEVEMDRNTIEGTPGHRSSTPIRLTRRV